MAQQLSKKVGRKPRAEDIWESMIQRERVLQLKALYRLPLYKLPTELIISILDLVHFHDLPTVITGLRHILRHHGIIPMKLAQDIEDLLMSNLPRWSPGIARTGHVPGLKGIPTEVFHNIVDRLSSPEKVNYVLATLPNIERYWDEQERIRNSTKGYEGQIWRWM